MSKRGNRGTALSVRLAVAAAVVAGGGATAVVAVNAGHSGPLAAQPAGYDQPAGSRTMSYSSAMSAAMNGWSQRHPGTSLTTVSHMKPVASYWTQSWHRVILFLQRGTVVAVSRHELVVRSANGRIDVWHVNGGTKTLNVGGSPLGMSAMTGGSTRVPWKHFNTKATGVARGDVVFVFGERENPTLKAQLVLFAAPAMTRTMPGAMPSATMTTPAAMPSAAMTTPAAMPSATMTTPVGMPATATTPPAPLPASTQPVVSGTHF